MAVKKDIDLTKKDLEWFGVHEDSVPETGQQAVIKLLFQGEDIVVWAERNTVASALETDEMSQHNRDFLEDVLERVA